MIQEQAAFDWSQKHSTIIANKRRKYLWNSFCVARVVLRNPSGRMRKAFYRRLRALSRTPLWLRLSLLGLLQGRSWVVAGSGNTLYRIYKRHVALPKIRVGVLK
jgi:hypothetical protein